MKWNIYMIVIVSGTNRPGSNTRKVTARVEASYKRVLRITKQQMQKLGKSA
jgi:hypothetical protein